MTHLLTAEAEIAAAAVAAAYLDLGGTQAGKLLAGIAVQARNVGRLDRLTIGAATGKRVGLDRGETISARDRLVNIGWLRPDTTGPRSVWTLTRPSDLRPQPGGPDLDAELLAVADLLQSEASDLGTWLESVLEPVDVSDLLAAQIDVSDLLAEPVEPQDFLSGPPPDPLSGARRPGNLPVSGDPA